MMSPKRRERVRAEARALYALFDEQERSMIRFGVIPETKFMAHTKRLGEELARALGRVLTVEERNDLGHFLAVDLYAMES